MKKLSRSLRWLTLFWLSSISSASTLWDNAYSYKHMVAAVVNTDAEPVYGEQVERALADYLRHNPRFEFSNAGYLKLKDRLKAIVPGPSLGDPGEEKVTAVMPLMSELASMKVHAAVLAEVRKSESSDAYFIVLVLLTTAPSQVTVSKLVTVENPHALDSFSRGAEQGIAELLRTIPFDATILSRVSNTVVIDRGESAFRVGMHVPVFTIESSNTPIRFESLGTVVISRVERDLTFGKVATEHRPGEIAAGNKLRFTNPPEPEFRSSPTPLMGESGEGRSLASMEPELFYRASSGQSQGRIGFVDVGAGGTAISIDNRATPDGPGILGNYAYSVLHIGTEIWITSRFFVDLGGHFSLTQVGGTEHGPSGDSSGMRDFRGQVGYRIHFYAPDPGPFLHFKLGYGSQSFSSNATSALGFSSLSYGGLALGAGMGIPLSSIYGLGIDLNALLLASASATPDSGESHGVSGWDFALSGYYRLSPSLRLNGKLIFMGNGAEFASGPIRYARQSGKGLAADLAYYF